MSTFGQMLEKKYTNIVYFIGVTIVITIAVQFYWNYKVYQINKQQLSNQIKVSFDKAVDDYYNDLAKTNILTFSDIDSSFTGKTTIAKIENNKNKLWIDGRIDSNHSKNIVKIRSEFSNIDTINVRKFNINDSDHLSVFTDEIDTLKIKNLTTKIMFSFQEKLIDLKKVDSLLQDNLLKKEIEVPYGLEFKHRIFLTDTTEKMVLRSKRFNDNSQFAIAKSTFLPHESELKLLYKTPTKMVLSTMIGSILLSLLLAGIIIGCLIFLLKVISNQKQLSEIKNDLIGNITHEFKTPIATIAIALEGLQKFDALKEPEKAEKYLTISEEQVGKLNTMVEKLLETATLKSSELQLDTELLDVKDVINKLVSKHQFSSSKDIQILNELPSFSLMADRSHLENAINNIIDNAVKYGGDKITINSIQKGGDLEIEISDNGTGIAKKNQDKIFDQFYRVSSGNIHDVKGFGIGLYYTKNIIRAHGGTLTLKESIPGNTCFKIVLKND